MDRRNPAFNAWNNEVAADVAFRESKGRNAQMAFPFTKGDFLLRDLRQSLSQSQKCEDGEEDGNG
jgi:hypothetical protein